MPTPPKSPPKSLRLRSTTSLPLKSASAVAPVPGVAGAWLVVDDDRGLFRVEDGDARRLRGPDDHDGYGDLEGVCVDDDGRVWVVAEGSGVVLRCALAGRATDEIGAIASPRAAKAGAKKKKKGGGNKGFEGLAWLPASSSPDGRAGLLVAHEDKPKVVLLLDPGDLSVRVTLALDDVLDDALDDVADLAVDVASGAILLLSDESACVGVARIAGERLESVCVIALPIDADEKPEGIAFVDDDTLAIVTDESAQLRLFTVLR